MIPAHQTKAKPVTTESAPPLVVTTREGLNLLVDVLSGFTADQRDMIKKIVRSAWFIGADTGLTVGLALGAKSTAKSQRPKGLAAKSKAERDRILMLVDAVTTNIEWQRREGEAAMKARLGNPEWRAWTGPRFVKAMMACGLTRPDAEVMRDRCGFRQRPYATRRRGPNKRPSRGAR